MPTTLTILLGSILAGCVAQADYDQLMVANKAALAEREAAEQRALDAETQSEALRTQLLAREEALAAHRALVENLKGENDQLETAFGSMQEVVKGVNFSPQRPLIIQTQLPPALDHALRNFAASHPDAVEYDASRGMVKWKSDLLFASGSDVVREDAKSTLRSFAAVVNTVEASNFDIVVAGHTDDDPIRHSRARHPTNWHLSAHRAIAVSQELLEAQIDPARLAVVGYGEHRAFVPNASDQNKALNRRVEIYISGRPTADTQNQPVTGQPQK
jgi:chemotaxis protein MotB